MGPTDKDANTLKFHFSLIQSVTKKQKKPSDLCRIKNHLQAKWLKLWSARIPDLNFEKWNLKNEAVKFQNFTKTLRVHFLEEFE